MSIEVRFVATRKKRIKVAVIPAYWQEYIAIEEADYQPSFIKGAKARAAKTGF